MTDIHPAAAGASLLSLFSLCHVNKIEGKLWNREKKSEKERKKFASSLGTRRNQGNKQFYLSQ
jgi:hypothetical protein